MSGFFLDKDIPLINKFAGLFSNWSSSMFLISSNRVRPTDDVINKIRVEWNMVDEE